MQWSPTPPQPADEALAVVRAEAAALTGTLTVARVLVGQRRSVDLAGLDGLIGRLCARALDLPPAEGRQMRAVLSALLDEVEALAALLAAPAPD
ncbi:MAG: hypothetical protein ACP5NI_05845 [Acetobacteraceae bacterium]